MMECLHFGEDTIATAICNEMEAAANEFVDEQFPSSGGRHALLGDDTTAHHADLICTVFLKLGSTGGESGTAMFALRQEVTKSGNKMPALLRHSVLLLLLQALHLLHWL